MLYKCRHMRSVTDKAHAADQLATVWEIPPGNPSCDQEGMSLCQKSNNPHLQKLVKALCWQSGSGGDRYVFVCLHSTVQSR